MEAFHNPTHNEGVSKDRKIRSSTHLPRKANRKNSLFEEDMDMRESQITIKSDFEDDIRSSGNSTHSKDDKRKKSKWSSLFNLDKIKKKIKEFT